VCCKHAAEAGKGNARVCHCPSGTVQVRTLSSLPKQLPGTQCSGKSITRQAGARLQCAREAEIGHLRRGDAVVEGAADLSKRRPAACAVNLGEDVCRVQVTVAAALRVHVLHALGHALQRVYNRGPPAAAAAAALEEARFDCLPQRAAVAVLLHACQGR
jgi:hypothetical protein